MTILDVAQAHFVSRFGECEAQLAGSGPAWLAPVRRAAIERFAELGFPTRKNEAWKYTSVSEIAKASLDPKPPTRDGISRDDLHELLGGSVSPDVFVFEDGRFAPELSSDETLPAGVEVGSLADALGEHPELIRPLLDRPDPLDRPFAALNGAFQRDGAFVRVTAGTTPERPIQLLFIASPGASGRVANPRNIIRIDRGAKAAIALRYESRCPGVYWTNAMTQILLEDNAELDLITLQLDRTSRITFPPSISGRSATVASDPTTFLSAARSPAAKSTRDSTRPEPTARSTDCFSSMASSTSTARLRWITRAPTERAANSTKGFSAAIPAESSTDPCWCARMPRRRTRSNLIPIC